jgi:penicillin amidase
MAKHRHTTGAGLKAAASLLAVAASLAAAGHYWLLRRPLARTKGTVRLPGLQDEVEVLRDRWGVPHIYASDLHDLMFAQGFVHAQDRLWQMDFHRRLVAGRLSEIMGQVTVPVDCWLRILGMRRVAEREVDLLGPQTRLNLETYAAGINARIAQGRLPVEFTLLRYRPEPWTVADTLSWVKMMSWYLSVNWESELLRAQLIAHLGPERAAELEPSYPEGKPYIVPPGVDLGALDTNPLEHARTARPYTGPTARDGLGSNSWVLSGSRTATGAPLLANDMHLFMTLPSIWYENHLIANDLNITGITFPGIPGVVSGHNGQVAWGFTNGFADVQDLYVERLRRGDDGSGKSRVQYEYQGQWLDAELIHEEIHVKGGETVVKEIIVTRHGPVINALAPDLAGEMWPESVRGAPSEVVEGAPPEVAEGLALRWTSLEPDGMIEAVFAWNQARNCLEFREALRHWTGPIQNVVYADTKGNIAYSYPGKVPIRAKGDGRVPVPGWTDEYEWLGYIPFEELPHLFNPPQGYVVTANNRVVGDDYAYHLGSEFALGDRAQRIVELIEAREQIDVTYVKGMHFDQVSHTARAIGRHLGQLPVNDPELAVVVERMRDWDSILAAGSASAAIHQVFLRRMIQLLLQDKVGDLTIRYAGKGPTPMLAEASIFGSTSWVWLLEVLTQPSSTWFDLGHGETRDDVMRLALRQTVDLLKTELGPEIEDWAWGKLHTLTYAHTLGRVKPLDKLFNRGPYPIGGDGTTVWATGASRHDLSSQGIVGPSFRFVADLGDLRNSWGLLVPGQSGQPGSKHYDDQIQAWFTGEYHPMLYEREDVERGAQAHLHLVPTEESLPLRREE